MLLNLLRLSRAVGEASSGMLTGKMWSGWGRAICWWHAHCPAPGCRPNC